jgi:DNA-binding Lrp family transcriptional regulator
MLKLKDTDKKLLNLLQQGDMAVPRVTRLAHTVGIPTTTVHERLKILQREGYIKGYVGIVEPEKVGKGYVALFFLNISYKKDASFREAVIAELIKIPQIQAIYYVTGEWDIALKLVVKDSNEYYDVTTKRILTIPGISKAMGTIVPKVFKDVPTVAVD